MNIKTNGIALAIVNSLLEADTHQQEIIVRTAVAVLRGGGSSKQEILNILISASSVCPIASDVLNANIAEITEE